VHVVDGERLEPISVLALAGREPHDLVLHQDARDIGMAIGALAGEGIPEVSLSRDLAPEMETGMAELDPRVEAGVDGTGGSPDSCG
jgi:hypothetical protein